MMVAYLITKEVTNKLTWKFLCAVGILASLPLIYFFIVHRSYEFSTSYDIFTFLLRGILELTFPILVALIYLGSFSLEIDDRFLFYTRSRISIKNYLTLKFSANLFLCFSIFFLFTFSMFLLSFYVLPHYQYIQAGFADAETSFFALNNLTAESYTLSHSTFTQLFAYGPLAYGLFYSTWVGMNAALYASIGFLLLLVLNNRFLALALPYIFYLVGSFMLGAIGLRIFEFHYSIFPFGFVQQPFWVPFVPFAFLVFICLLLFLYIKKNAERLDNLL